MTYEQRFDYQMRVVYRHLKLRTTVSVMCSWQQSPGCCCWCCFQEARTETGRERQTLEDKEHTKVAARRQQQLGQVLTQAQSNTYEQKHVRWRRERQTMTSTGVRRLQMQSC